MRIISIAAIVGGLIAAPVSAVADETLTESFSITLAHTLNLNGNQLPVLVGSSGQFHLFNEATGTLDDVSITLSGALTAVTFTGATLTFDLLDHDQTRVGTDTIDAPPGTSTINVSVKDANDTQHVGDFIGEEGLGFFSLFVSSPGLAAIQSGGTLTGSITYDYTPAAMTPSVPETSTWAMMIIGFASLAFAGRNVRGRFLNWSGFAGPC